MSMSTNSPTTRRCTSPRKRHVEVARRLIEAGADINAKDDIDQTPGDRARFWKQDKVLELLDSNSILEAA